MLFIKSLYGNDLINLQILCNCAKLYRRKIGAVKKAERNNCEKMYV